ncbi:hypothetical protein ACH4S8_43875 [Streptomyces sp. NPDC021080]|uniref:hypothetical protein n=1 Tax=Streptomyces sp. NPDC021080 TaxID=3365110 RepID=UPI0037A659FB
MRDTRYSAYDGTAVTVVAQATIDHVVPLAEAQRIVFRPQGAKGFVVRPRRWKVERTIGWCMNARRNARDHERLPQHFEAH